MFWPASSSRLCRALFATPTAAMFSLSLGPSAARAGENPANNPAPINADDCRTN